MILSVGVLPTTDSFLGVYYASSTIIVLVLLVYYYYTAAYTSTIIVGSESIFKYIKSYY